MKQMEKTILRGGPTPIILGAYVNALGICRSLGLNGIQSIVLDSKMNICFKSRYATPVICPDPSKEEGAFLEFLESLGKSMTTRGILFFTNDVWMIPVLKAKKRLEQYFIFPLSDWSVIETCLDKSKLHSHCEGLDIGLPKTRFVDGAYELETISAEMVYPCVIKPAITVGFMEALGSSGRTLAVENADEMLEWRDKILEAGMRSIPLIVQEKIPGDASNLYTITSLSDEGGRILAYSTGHKIRQAPWDNGTIVSGRVVHDFELYKLASTLIESLPFHGVANTEFKFDHRDNRYKLIEINPRPGMWNFSATRTGVNLSILLYRYYMGERPDDVVFSQDEIVWMMSLDDLVRYLKHECEGRRGVITAFKGWLRSVSGKKVDAVFCLKDPLPWFDYFGRLLFINLTKSKRTLENRKRS